MVSDLRPKIRLLGEPRLEVGGEAVAFRTSKVPALLAYLVARTGRAVLRTEVAGALWPDREPAAGLQNLRQTLLYLRGPLGEMLMANRREVRLPPGLADCDVDAFREALAARPPDPARAVALYGGPFLAGFDDEWLVPVRAELSHGFVRALLELSDRELSGDPAAALGHAERAVAEEPFHDGARARKIRALRGLGEEALALREFESYEALLTEELGLRPAPIVEDALTGRSATPSPAPHPEDRVAVPSTLADALGRLGAGERPGDAVRLAVALAPYWIEVGTPGEGLRQLDAARAGWPEPHEPRLRGATCLAAGELALRVGDFDRMAAEATEALELDLAPDENVAALVLLGRTHLRGRETARARFLLLRALRLARRSDVPTGGAWAALGAAYLLEDRPVPAIAAARRAQAAAGGSRRLFARAGILVGSGLATLGRDGAARAAMEEAVEAVAGDPSSETAGLRVTAARQFEEFGDLARAARGYREGIEEFRGRGDPWSLALSLTYLGDLEAAGEDPAGAIPLYEEAMAIRRAAGDVLGEATCLRGIGSARLALGQVPEAQESLREAVRRYAEVDWNPGVASCLVPLARAEAAVGSREVAGRLAARAAALLRAMPPATRMAIGPRGAALLPEAEALARELATGTPLPSGGEGQG